MLPYALAALTAFLLCSLFTPVMMKLAVRLDLMDHPNTVLKQQTHSVPYLGGAAVFLAFGLSLAVTKLAFFPAVGMQPWPAELHLFRGIIAILAGGGAALALGLVDDARVLSPSVKFIGQILGALLLVAVGLRLRFVDNQVLSIVLTVLWVVTVTNALNFVDIMDGLAAGVAGIAAVGFFFFAMNAGRYNDALAAVALAGACFGFLPYNFAPARIYLGDAGSHFLGFTLAAISLNLQYSHQNVLAVFSPLLILFLPLFDLMLMTVIRTKRGHAPWRGSPDHIPLRLRQLGLSKVATVLTLYAATAALSVFVYLISFLKDRQALLFWAFFGIAALVLAVWLMSIRMPHEAALDRK